MSSLFFLNMSTKETSETDGTKTEDTLNKEACAQAVKFLMTNHDTGHQWSYAESRMRYG